MTRRLVLIAALCLGTALVGGFLGALLAMRLGYGCP